MVGDRQETNLKAFSQNRKELMTRGAKKVPKEEGRVLGGGDRFRKPSKGPILGEELPQRSEKKKKKKKKKKSK